MCWSPQSALQDVFDFEWPVVRNSDAKVNVCAHIRKFVIAHGCTLNKAAQVRKEHFRTDGRVRGNPSKSAGHIRCRRLGAIAPARSCLDRKVDGLAFGSVVRLSEVCPTVKRLDQPRPERISG